jgi:AraC-like DNA-binding protein/GNAT superfamily N-acetyltransferase
MDYNDMIQRSFIYIEKNLNGDLSVEALARFNGYSKFHFCRIFHDCTGISVMTYIRQRRFINAAAALKDGKPIIEIAMDYGFSSQGGFNKAFKKLYGFSPGEYRIQALYKISNEIELFSWEYNNVKEDFSMRFFNANCEKDLQKGFELAEKTYGHFAQTEIEKRDFWLNCLKNTPELLVYAEKDDKICGVAWGKIDGEAVTISFIIVEPEYRNQGIGTALLKELEKRVKAKGYNFIAVAAMIEEEAFYFKSGLTPNLFIQAKDISHDKLRALNPGYIEVGVNVYNGWNTLMLKLPEIDRSLQEKYQIAFPSCSTQIVFTKQI